jgi:hypothetical protein
VPSPENPQFKDHYVRDAFLEAIEGTPLEHWNYNWKVIQRHDEFFTQFIEVSARVMYKLYEPMICHWFIKCIVYGCISFFSTLGFSQEKYKIAIEMRAALPDEEIPP